MTNISKMMFIFCLVAFSMLEMKPQQSSSPPTHGVPIALKRRPDGNSSGRKRIPQKDIVYCWYSDGNIYFDFSELLGRCDIEIINQQTNLVIGATCDSSESTIIYVGNVLNLSIMVTCENGLTYLGIINM